MNKKLIGILIILSGLIIIISIIYVLFFDGIFKNKETQDDKSLVNDNSEPIINNLKTTVSEKDEIKKEIMPPVKKKITGEDLGRTAMSFVERFGSYSNHSNYSNILDLKIFMSKNMQKWADEYVLSIRSKSEFNNIYYGITTKAILKEIRQFDEDANRAEILVKTQRRESNGTMSNSSTFYQDILVVFIIENGAWKIDSAYWQDK